MTSTTYGLLRRDGLTLALPLQVLREVLPMPEQLEDLPHDVEGVVGAHVLRGRVLPVIDLSVVVKGRHEPDCPRILAVLRHGSAVLAVIADGAEGIVTVAQEAQTRMADSRRSVASIVFTHPGVEGVVSVLDVDLLFARYADVAIRVDETADMAAVHGSGSASRQHSWDELPVLMATCDDLGIGVPIGSVDGMQTTSSIIEGPLTGGPCLGVIAYRGVEVPLVDVLDLLGLGRTTVQPVNECLVLSLDGGFVALLISSVVQLHHVPEQDVQPLPTFGFARPDMLRGLWDGGPIGRFVLIAQPLIDTDDLLTTLSRLNHPIVDGAAGGGRGGGAEATRAARRRSGLLESLTTATGAVEDSVEEEPDVTACSETYVTFVAGVDLATPVQTVDAIVDLPADLVVYETTTPWLAGLFDHRGSMIPLVSLRTLLGQPPPDVADPVVLVMRSPGGHVGFQVDRLLAIASSNSIIPARDRASGLTTRDLDEAPYALIGPDREMVPIIDLEGLCREITGGLLVS